jgi:hypothetical protein
MRRARRALIAVTAASLFVACGADSYWVRSDEPAAARARAAAAAPDDRDSSERDPAKTLNTRSKSPNPSHATAHDE